MKVIFCGKVPDFPRPRRGMQDGVDIVQKIDYRSYK